MLNALLNGFGCIMRYAYASKWGIIMFSVFMALVLVLHLKSTFIILSQLCEPSPPPPPLPAQQTASSKAALSAINIQISDVQLRAHQQQLSWHYYDELPPAILLENNGSVVIMRISCAPRSLPYLSGGELAGRYYFVEAAFKWCRSEHAIDSCNYALELQVLHATNRRNAPFEYLTLCYLFSLAPMKPTPLDQVVANLPAIKQPGSVTELPPFDLNSLLYPFTSDYYSYSGSYANGNTILSTQWFICSRIFTINSEQLAQFCSLRVANGQTKIVKNAQQQKIQFNHLAY
ncbi:CG15227 [Drosophila busckii]|uniref:CG15227 n=1 Tax=Drosophila busckii TaxID=30019 RepID=A0A0M4ECN9_DROBS|nr:CG15227 [Drosophila busckii]